MDRRYPFFQNRSFLESVNGKIIKEAFDEIGGELLYIIQNLLKMFKINEPVAARDSAKKVMLIKIYEF